MNDIKVSNIGFDNHDGELFFIDDLQLKGEALKHSVVPRLSNLIYLAHSLVLKIYQIDFF